MENIACGEVVNYFGIHEKSRCFYWLTSSAGLFRNNRDEFYSVREGLANNAKHLHS